MLIVTGEIPRTAGMKLTVGKTMRGIQTGTINSAVSLVSLIGIRVSC